MKYLTPNILLLVIPKTIPLLNQHGPKLSLPPPTTNKTIPFRFYQLLLLLYFSNLILIHISVFELSVLVNLVFDVSDKIDLKGLFVGLGAF